MKFVEKFKGLGTKKHKFYIKTKYGEGELLNARYLFKDNKYPNFIERNYCFFNCFEMAHLIHRDDKRPCKVLGGICGVGDYPVLHAILEFNGEYVIDFNLDVVCKKELYCSLFGFEILEELDGEEITEFYEKCEHYEFPIGWGFGYLIFSPDETIQYFEDYNNNVAEYIEPIGDF